MCNKAKDIRDFDSFYELIEYFSSEAKCIDHLAQIRWNGEPQCPYCGSLETYEFHRKDRGKNWKCAKKECHKQFSVRIGTIFEESRLPLRKWFFAIWLITSHKKGISSYQLSRDLKITQKSAWFVLHRVRKAFEPHKDEVLGLDKIVEIDETWVGGDDKNRHKDKKVGHSYARYQNTKIPVLGILEREGVVYAVPVNDNKRATLLPIMAEKVSESATVYTDSASVYRVLGKHYKHEFVNHKAHEYVRGDVSTQSIESFWAIVKRTIFGIYHHTSDTHLGKYINECTFRFNNRHLSEGSRFDVTLANTKGRLTYKELINEKYQQA